MKAWLGQRDGMAVVCAWCPDKAAADAKAEQLGLRCTHGICDACTEREFAAARADGVPVAIKARQAGRDIDGDSFAAGCRFSCAVGSATAGRDRRTFSAGTTSRHAPRLTAAAASTPTVPAACGDQFVAASLVAEAAGVTLYALLNRHQPAHWGAPHDFRLQGREVLYRVAALPDLEDALGEAGLVDEAARLRRWWMQRTTAFPQSQPSTAEPWYRKGDMA